MSTRSRLPALAAAITLTVVSGCAKGPLDTTCEEFLTLLQSEQHDIAVAWAMDTLKQQDMAEASANTSLPAMLEYCGTDPDAKIGELTYTFGR